MTLEELFTSYINPRLARVSAEHRNWIIEVQGIMWTIFTESNNGRQTRSTSASTTSSLLVIFTHGRNIAQADRDQGANINTNFHGGCAAKDINRCFTILD